MMKVFMYENGVESAVPAGRADVTVVAEDGVSVVHVRALAAGKMDAQFALRVRLDMPQDIEEWMVDRRHSEFWCSPAFGKEWKDLPDETQLLLCKRYDGTYRMYLPLVSDGFKSVLGGDEEGAYVRVFAGREEHACYANVLVYADGDDPYELTERLTRAGLKASGRAERLREDRHYPEVFEYLGWCSWDSMQIRVNEDGVKQKCREFLEKGIPVRWIILDDMWGDIPDFKNVPYRDFREMVQLMHASRMRSFEPDPERFPHGLKALIDTVKNDYGMVTGMWHPTTGYWYGVTKDGPIYKELGGNMLELEDGRIIPHYEMKKAFAFYDAFHSYLEKCGAAFVKVDNQSQYNRFYRGMENVDSAVRQYHSAIEASVAIHFGGAMINCMGGASEDWWSRPYSCVTRCSDDFLPENRDWFTKHIMQCSFTSFAQSPLTWCDWDMWWTDDGQAVKNSVLRAISGGPIYVSDQLERSRAEILLPLCLTDGRILRCDRPAAPARDSLTRDPVKGGTLFKLQNTACGSGVIAAFDLAEDDRPVSGTISPSDCEEIEWSDEGYAVYEYFSGKCVCAAYDEEIPVELANRDEFRLYDIVPVRDGYAPIGLKGKMIAPATIEKTLGHETVLKEGGTFLYWNDGRLCEEER